MSNKERIVALEKRVKTLEQCHHTYEVVGGRNSNYVHYYSGCYAYILCTKCGHKKQA